MLTVVQWMRDDLLLSAAFKDDTVAFTYINKNNIPT